MTADHTAQFEEVMALLDGELPADAAERVRQHLTSCAVCQRLADDLGAVSENVRGWTVGKAPATLQPRQTAKRPGRRAQWAAAAAVVLATGSLAILMQARRSPSTISLASKPPQASVEASVPETVLQTPVAGNLGAGARRVEAAAEESKRAEFQDRTASGPLIIRNASLSLIVRDYETGRAELERIAREVNGFIGSLAASGARGTAPSLHAALRVPAARLDETLAALKRLGTVQQERQSSDDVTQQSTDLDARLANARASEARLSAILKNRTGRLSDVLAVEREIARVRGEIEQMEAERKNMDGRIAYATVDIEMTTERKAEALTGPVSISTRLRNAVVDGYAKAVERAISFAVFVAEIAPTVVLWVLVLAPPLWLFHRSRMRRA